ncbi:Glycosyl transferase family 4, partial [Trinorchestia longiramus]
VALLVSAVLSVVGGMAVHKAVSASGDTFVRAGLWGHDLCKKEPKRVIPEATGMISGTVFLMVMFVFTGIQFSRHLLQSEAAFPHLLFEQLLTALLCICCMLLLGFADDVLNLKWRYKLVLPTLASLPLLMTHFVKFGSTTVVIPLQLRPFLGNNLNIG